MAKREFRSEISMTTLHVTSMANNCWREVKEYLKKRQDGPKTTEQKLVVQNLTDGAYGWAEGCL